MTKQGMDVLVLGGTQFVGRHIVEALLLAGHRVAVFTRGRTPDELPETVERLHGDRDGGAVGLAALAERTWDTCVDVSGYTPRQVRASAEALHGSVGRYVFVSTVSVYGEPERHPVREDDPLLPEAAEDVTEVTGQTYGPLKVTCERIVEEVYGEQRSALLRPQIVAGPHDPTGRYTYWVDRIAAGGRFFAPGDGSDSVQVIDARDLARFTVTVLEGGLSGAYNLAGPRLSWREFVAAAREATGSDAQPVWTPAEVLQGGELGLPLWLPAGGPQGGLMDVANSRAVAAGLTLTGPEVTARDTRAWSAGTPQKVFLTPGREAEVLAEQG
ncbi:NAD-dependent epimerase/dehydratase family protein [Deinococcus sp. MIMF12]|uniref:UDP-glucose 4-epimerase n=1 Tax=Deinococcus rhizophilus TaxID=3049544 RepID=A0ABT7JDX0_9DEIO|nr:NAD-dependent epimerase/dehydratase family protein [Deinococcus rhizophilus]MDL2343251.1 NAD-dependent epimerase/dehydratase family protein [Deinococcus rhizophilus]